MLKLHGNCTIFLVIAISALFKNLVVITFFEISDVCQVPVYDALCIGTKKRQFHMKMSRPKAMRKQGTPFNFDQI